MTSPNPTTPAPNPPASLDGYLRRLNRLAGQPAPPDSTTETARQLTAWADSHHDGSDDTGLVTATITGRGDLLDLDISDRALRRLGDQRLGAACLRALTAAHTTAANNARQLGVAVGADPATARAALHTASRWLDTSAGSPQGQQRRAQLAATLAAVLDRADRAAGVEHTASSTDQAITATTSGAGTLTEVQLRPGTTRELDNLTLAESIREAITAARRAAHAALHDSLQVTLPDGRP